jgi:hypothetical protein
MDLITRPQHGIQNKEPSATDCIPSCTGQVRKVLSKYKISTTIEPAGDEEENVTKPE